MAEKGHKKRLKSFPFFGYFEFGKTGILHYPYGKNKKNIYIYICMYEN